jgi:RimJ/RimL family protein N-acetyltransferase
MTVEQNRRDLERHWDEFETHKGYAYTVLRPDGSKCLGCVYISPVKDNPDAAELAYWVIESELATDFDKHLLATLLDWFRATWPLDSVVLSHHQDNKRGIAIAEAQGLTRSDRADEDHAAFTWRR